MKKAIAIVGPTAVGKTDLAFYLHKKISSTQIRSGPILISADSVQVYRGADIISGKDSSVLTELLDVVDPTESFSISEFSKRVSEIINRTNKLPIIVGGTGFYLDSLFGKVETINTPQDSGLRIKLGKLSVAELQAKLKELNSERFDKMNNSDVNNPRRLIRAIEIASRKGMIDHTFSKLFDEDKVVFIGLKTSMENLKKRIKVRVEKRIEMGAIDEAKKMFENYENLSEQLKTANGYKELFDYLLGKVTLAEAIKNWETADYHHAKNQMTWFNRNKKIHWFDIQEKGFENKVLSLVQSSL